VKHLRVLHVEDDPLDAELLVTTLKDAGIRCDVVRVDAGPDFTARLERTEFDLIISDLSLPRFDGRIALEIARQLRPDTPFIFVSGTIGEEAAIESLLGGATDYVLKHKFSRLVPAVQRAMREADERKARRETEEALRISEERYRQLFESNPHPMWVYDADTLAFLAVNDAAVEGYGYSREEFLKMTMKDIWPPGEQKLPSERESKTASSIRRTPARRHKKKDGTIIEVDAASHELPFAGRTARLVQANDVTEKKKIEEQLLRAQRVESIGTLASGIAHDLNNVLSPILMGLQLLRSTPSGESASRTIDTLELSARRAADLIKQILTFARGIQGQRGALQIRHLLGDVQKILGETMPKSIRIESDISKNLSLVSGDGTQLHQLFMNLCINARDAMPAGGALRISANNMMIDQMLHHRNLELKPGAYVAIEVADTGEGIPAGVLDRIFEPFFTTKPLGKGTGLGLSTVQTIVKNHEGFLDVDTQVGRGTTFTVYLPATSVEAVTHQEKLQAVPAGNGELILIVDDEAAIRDIARTTLEVCGYRVVTASNGADGLEVFRENRREIRAVVSDMNMPQVDGQTMIDFMVRMNPDLRFVCASGLSHDQDSASTPHSSGKMLSLRKPFTAEELLGALNTVLSAP
jgi:two-component system cell cycle sensor histidine kinase/response regulator CckA